MPGMRIPRVEGQIRAPGPIQGVEGVQGNPSANGGASGKALQSLGGTVGDVAKVVINRQEQSEVSDLNTKFAQAQADYTKKWQETLQSADPGDKDVASKFMQDFNDHAESLGEGLSTRAGQLFFQRQKAELGAHFETTANAMTAELAGMKARQDYTRTVDSLSESLINDPALFEKSLASLDEQIGIAVAGGMPRKAALELQAKDRATLAKNTVEGYMQKDPEGTRKRLEAGEWAGYLDGDTKLQLMREIHTTISAQHADAERQRQQAERVKKERQNAQQTTFLAQLVKGELTAQEVIQNKVLDSFGSGSKEQFIGLIQKMNAAGGKMTKDPSRFVELFQAIHDGTLTDENDLNEYVGDGIDEKWLQTLRNEMQGKGTIEGDAASQAKDAMTKTAYQVLARPDALGVADPQGAENYKNFLLDFIDKWNLKVQQGVSARRLRDPKDPEYMGNDYLAYNKDTLGRVQALGMAAGGGAVPVSSMAPAPEARAPVAPNTNKARKPNESAAEYLQRMGK